ncbi:E3 ubiquitin- ligase DZIP3 [Paramuricea clavata]|uniref:E3 ubiquitin- ligase DZIP3 n=1 Tax=Paramuricea clavata TaxID=317549 RepID=A0A7D9JPH2_PARCT|nr:E3 ubiquitin- ligase DZIP3 [Paramuricea clavata]
MMDPVKAKANYSRVCQLLVDKGGEALRGALHAKHPPSTLATVLNANKRTLNKIRYSVIKPSQWDLLFPVSGSPDSNNFDITLLTILLRNICGLTSPATGWNVMPSPSDTSESANIARIKIFRNEVYGHIPSPQLDDTRFETLWQEISKPLIKLGIPQQDIDELKEATLSAEEESYIEKLKEWKELEDDLLSKLKDLERGVLNVENEVLELRRIVENVVPSQVDQLAKFDFTGKIDGLCKKFQDGTRKWFFEKLSSWFDDEESRVMILTAGPGAGKSVLSAKICEMYKERGQLAAYHFCDFRNADSRNPHRILQSLASQMCDNVHGFSDILTEVLRREHSRDSLSDAFRVLLNDPLHALDSHKPMLIVVDALDESKTEDKSEFLELISENFRELPEWIKIFITSRPELQVRKELQCLNPVEILPDDHHHKRDLEHFIHHCLPKLNEGNVNFLVSKCEGSFLYAYYLVDELKKMDLGIEPNLSDYVPKGISGFYEKQFKRLRTMLQSFHSDTWSPSFKRFVNVIAASRAPLPIKILFACIDLSGEEFEIREAIIGIMSEILPVYEGCLTVYHKSLWDWLKLDGYEEHAFVADVADGSERLWRACKSIYSDINGLRSISDFQMSPETRYALENGGKYLLDVADTEDFHWLVNVRVNYLKRKFCEGRNVRNVDYFHILETYKSKLSDHLYWKFVQLHAFSNSIYVINPMDDQVLYKGTHDKYLMYLANGRIDFELMQNTNSCKNTARDILNETDEIWFEEVTNETNNSSFTIMSKTVVLEPENNGIALSPNNKLLACRHRQTVNVFELPSLTKSFKLDVSEVIKSNSSLFLTFSPDSSYFLYNSIRSCVCIREQKETPFIPHGPKSCYFSFSSCGTKLVTLENKRNKSESSKPLIKVWDVKKKHVLVKTKFGFYTIDNPLYGFFSNSNSYILVWERGDCRKNFHIFDSTTLKRIYIQGICVDTCLEDEDDFPVASPPPLCSDPDEISSIRIDHLHLLTGERILIRNKICSKPFTWKDRKCVVSSNLVENVMCLHVYDFINQEIVDTFQISCVRGCDVRITYLSNLDEFNFLICLDFGLVFVLSLQPSSESYATPLVNNADIKCCALSSDNLYVASCYENRILTIKSVENGETLQTVLLTQPPNACWWSVLHLWVVCRGVIVKYPFDLTHSKVLGNELEERPISPPNSSVLKFAEGALVLCGEILKICNETLCPLQIPDLDLDHSNFVAISSDGCAVLLFQKESSDYLLCEVTHENRWKLSSLGKLSIFSDNPCMYFGLTGTKNCRRFSWLDNCVYHLSLHNISLSSTDLPNGTKDAMHKVETLPSDEVGVTCVYRDSNFVIIRQFSFLIFIRLSDGKCACSSFDIRDVGQALYLASQGLLLLVRSDGITKLKIHNIEKFLLNN